MAPLCSRVLKRSVATTISPGLNRHCAKLPSMAATYWFSYLPPSSCSTMLLFITCPFSLFWLCTAKASLCCTTRNNFSFIVLFVCEGEKDASAALCVLCVCGWLVLSFVSGAKVGIKKGAGRNETLSVRCQYGQPCFLWACNKMISYSLPRCSSNQLVTVSGSAFLCVSCR